MILPSPGALRTISIRRAENQIVINRLLAKKFRVTAEMETWSPEKLEYHFYRETVVSALATQDPHMLRQREIACEQRDTPLNVLIMGPTGTGKELLAKILHGMKPPERFISMNCAGITSTLFESEMFGHAGSSFTGAAKQDRIGKLEAAENGTIFLDEIGELPIDQQAKLLRALGEREITRVGSNDIIKINCRFVFATNKDLEAMSEEKPVTFRNDLYWRIAQIVLRTTSLIERPGDVPLIAAQMARKNDWTPLTLAELEHAEYAKGNCRQLENWLGRKEYGAY